ncbi:hypothetical protein Tco_0667921 [Tanacetum coccineum]
MKVAPLHLGPEGPRVYSDLSPKDKERYNADIRAINILLQGLPKDIYSLINRYIDAKDIWDNVKMATGWKFVNNMFPEWGRFLTAVKLNRGLRELPIDKCLLLLRAARRPSNENKLRLDDLLNQTYNAIDEDVDEQPVQDLALNVDNVFQVDDCDAFDSDVDEAPTTQTMFMANLSSADPVYDEVGPSYDSDILSELMVEEVTSLKKDFKQKENKYLEEFLDMKALKEKVKDKLYKQDQSLQTVHMLCKPKPYYDELNKVAIGYKNPLCLTRAKKVRPALYNGHEIIKTNHVPAIVHNSEDTLEIAKITRKKMNAKMKDPNKIKDEALKMQATTSRPIKALTVYPQNTPATLIPRVLPTKRERGFEQTKAWYLTKVIPFFKTLKEHFEDIQKALTKEIKEMKDIFKELEAKVDQNGVDRKRDEIERKNLLIANDNLIANCLSKEVFYVAMNSELNLKYQSLKESFGNNTSPPAQDVPDFDSVFVIEKMKASIQGKDNAIKKLRMQISQLKETRSEADHTLDFRTLDFQITQLTEKINVLQE